MHTYGWQRQVGLIGSLNFGQLFTVTLIRLNFPPAWDALTIPQVLNNLLDGFLGDGHLFHDLRANPVKLSRYCKFQVACLDLCNLLRCGCKRCWRWYLLTLGFGWSRRLRRFCLGGFTTLFSIRMEAIGARLPAHSRSRTTTETTLHWLPWALPYATRDTWSSLSIAAGASVVAIAARGIRDAFSIRAWTTADPLPVSNRYAIDTLHYPFSSPCFS